MPAVRGDYYRNAQPQDYRQPPRPAAPRPGGSGGYPTAPDPYDYDRGDVPRPYGDRPQRPAPPPRGDMQQRPPQQPRRDW
jgi:hypothetical protein